MRDDGRPADDEAFLSPQERQSLSQIEAELRRDIRLDRALTPRRRWTPLLFAPVWVQALVAVVGTTAIVAGLVTKFVAVGALGFIALVLATSALSTRWTVDDVVRDRHQP